MADKAYIVHHLDGEWQPSVAKDARPMSTVILDERIKNGLLQDVRDFLDPAAREQYHSTPYRRGYLFYGPTGTGKTILTLSIAGCFGLKIYAVTLSVDDNSFEALFAELPGPCIVLLEDVDVVESKSPGGMTSLSALLDVIDRLQDGHIVIMTTRHIERLDNALRQPGRVDMETEFRLSNKESIIRLFRLAFEDHESVDLLADQFAAKIPELEFSPAELLSFLIENRGSPEAAVDNAETWMARVRSERVKIQDGA